MNALFPDAVFVNYQTPGIELAIELEKQLVSKSKDQTKIIFLQNHGVIISSNSHKKIIETSDFISSTLEKGLNIDFSYYRYCNVLLNHLKLVCKNNNLVVFYSELISNKFYSVEKFVEPISPDVFVFCGYEIINIDEDLQRINQYFENFNEYPKIIKYRNHFYIVGNSIKKAKEQEELLNFQLYITHFLDNSNLKYNTISSDEMYYLGNWEAEKFRQKL